MRIRDKVYQLWMEDNKKAILPINKSQWCKNLNITTMTLYNAIKENESKPTTNKSTNNKYKKPKKLETNQDYIDFFQNSLPNK